MSQIDLVLLGAPGAGKGTQAALLSERLSISHISTGNIFRANLKNETDLGKLAKSYMDAGDLVPDDVTAAMVKDRLAQDDVASGFILDGFPRTVPQAQALTTIGEELGRDLTAVLYFNVSDDVVVARLSGRRICRVCEATFHVVFNPTKVEGMCDSCEGELYQRKDDEPATIQARLNTYHTQTAPLIGYYTEAGKLVEINGDQKIDEIMQIIMQALGS